MRASADCGQLSQLTDGMTFEFLLASIDALLQHPGMYFSRVLVLVSLSKRDAPRS